MNRSDLSIWLYGSHARGDADALSDVDVFVASDMTISKNELQMYLQTNTKQISISRYSWNEVTKMAEYGSLFFQHLCREGFAIWESNSRKGELYRILSNMGPYKYIKRDIRGFRTVIKDVYESLNDSGSKIFELSVIATVLRHCSILGCWVIGSPLFGRTEPVNKFIEACGLDNKITAEFPSLYNYRLYIDGRISLMRDSLPDEINIWLRRTEDVINALKGIYDGKHSKMF